MWETEHGPRGGDELNTPAAGKNYGWPVIVHGIDYPGATIGEGITEKAGMEQAHYYWDPVIAPSGLAFYTGNLFPQWKDSVFIGSLRGQMLDRVTLNGKRVVSEEPLLVDQKARVRDVRMGPEGAVYVLTDNGKLLKLSAEVIQKAGLSIYLAEKRESHLVPEIRLPDPFRRRSVPG